MTQNNNESITAVEQLVIETVLDHLFDVDNEEMIQKIKHMLDFLVESKKIKSIKLIDINDNDKTIKIIISVEGEQDIDNPYAFIDDVDKTLVISTKNITHDVVKRHRQLKKEIIKNGVVCPNI